MSTEALFSHSGPDSYARFNTFFGPLLLLAFSGLGWWSPKASAALLAAAYVLGLGLRCSITVKPTSVEICRTLFGLRYKRYLGRHIDHVTYGGDWGEDDGAFWMVIRIGEEEIDFGSRKTMHYVHASLDKLITSAAVEESPSPG